MTKKEALGFFSGNQAELGRAVGLSRGRISQWPEILTQKQADLVRGAALRLGMFPSNQNRKKAAA